MGSKAPDPPDFSAQIAALSQQSEVANQVAEKSYDLGLRQLDLQKQSFDKAAAMGDRYFQTYQQSFDKNQALLDEVWPSIREQMQLSSQTARKSQDYLDTQIAAARTSADRGTALWDRFTGKILPIQDRMIGMAESYFSPARASEDAARAKADVATQFDQARANTEAQLAGYGISPDEGRSRSFETITNNLRAAAQAAAGTSSRYQTEARALGLAGDIYNTGAGYPSQALNYATSTAGIGGAGFNAANASGAAGISAGLSGVGTANTIAPAANYASMALNPYVNALGPFGSSGTGIYGAGVTSQGQATQALMGAGNLQQAGFSDALASYQANNAATGQLFSGIGKLVGGGLGFMAGGPAGGMFGASLFSDPRLKEDDRVVGHVGALPLHQFRYKGDRALQLGFMADEVEALDPGAVIANAYGSGYKMVNYSRAAASAVRALGG